MSDMENRKINILGTEYRIEFRKEDEDTILKDCNGYCDVTVKLIVVLAEPNKECDYEDFSFIQKKTLRHEIVHAFLTESGLFNNTYNVDAGWEKNEEMVDWFAIQSPKIFKVYSELGLLEGCSASKTTMTAEGATMITACGNVSDVMKVLNGCIVEDEKSE
nr:MAG TPA: hypothetical protein [Caudoviricetes sp.]